MDNSDFQHYNRSERYVREIKKIYQALIKEVSGLMALGKIDLEKPFSFSDYPHLAKQFDEIFRFYTENLTLKIESYKGKEWRYGEVKAYQSAGVEVPKIKIPPVRPPKELSERVWKHLSQYKGELELGLDLSIGKGKSANEIARDLKQYLNEPDRLFRRVRDKHGNLHLSKNAQNYHPGQGVYRSSFKNAQRLARTETNRAYHEASWRKYQEWDFVVGYEVRLSNNPKHCPFCSAMAGKYPKEFKFFGWHPNCRCTTIPILAKDIDNVLESEKITELPKPMRDWLNDNADKIEKAKNKPWFVVENGEFLGRGKKGKVTFDKDCDPNDFHRNKYVAEICAKHTGFNFHIRKHLNIANVTNPEYLINNQYLADRKSILSNNGIITQIDASGKQMKNVFVNPNNTPYMIIWDLDFVENLDWSKIKHNLSKKITKERGRSIKGMFFQYKGKSIYISRESIVKRDFKLLDDLD